MLEICCWNITGEGLVAWAWAARGGGVGGDGGAVNMEGGGGNGGGDSEGDGVGGGGADGGRNTAADEEPGTSDDEEDGANALGSLSGVETTIKLSYSQGVPNFGCKTRGLGTTRLDS